MSLIRYLLLFISFLAFNSWNIKEQMTKQDLIRIIVIVILVLFLIGLVFFRKEKENNVPERANNGNIPKIEENNKKTEPTEEEKLKTMAENFATIYYSYSWGNFSNIESQYFYMTGEMQKREKNKVEQMKKDIENQPQKYFTARAKLIDSNFAFYKETNASVKINLNVDNIAGAIAQRDTMVWVDEKGDYYRGDIKDLIINTANKNVEINLIKIGNEWKVDEIGEK